MLIATISWWWYLLVPVTLLIVYKLFSGGHDVPKIDITIPETAQACSAKADGFFQQAHTQFKSSAAHYYRAALTLADTGLEMDAKHQECHLARAIALYKLEEFEEAIPNWEFCVAERFQLSKCLLHLGISYRKNNEIDKAVKCYTDLLDEETKAGRRSDAILNRTMALCDAERFDEAEEDLRRLQHSQDPQVVYHLALCRFRGDKDRAMQEFDKLTE